MAEFKTGQWVICDGEYMQVIGKYYRRGYVRDMTIWCRRAGTQEIVGNAPKVLTPSSLIPDFSNAKVGDECFSPILSHCQIANIDGNWEFYGDTNRFDVSEVYVKQKHTNNYMYYYPPRMGHHPSLYNSFAQFQAYWAEQALEMGGEK